MVNSQKLKIKGSRSAKWRASLIDEYQDQLKGLTYDSNHCNDEPQNFAPPLFLLGRKTISQKWSFHVPGTHERETETERRERWR